MKIVKTKTYHNERIEELKDLLHMSDKDNEHMRKLHSRLNAKLVKLTMFKNEIIKLCQ